MPIYEYKCNKCNNKFKKLVNNGNTDVHCPFCTTHEVKKLFSTFATSGVSTGKNSSCSSCASSSCSSCGH